MPSGRRLLLYGANGYTAGLLLQRLQGLGADVIAAGRNALAVRRVARRFGFEHRVFDLTGARALDAQLQGVDLLVNAAGPFVRTAEPLVNACLRQRIDYLDLSGEVDALQYVQGCDRFAKSQGILLLPGIGFDVAVSDCLALFLSERLPGADTLILSISPSNLLSRGSALALVEQAGTFVRVRSAGALEPVRFRTQLRWVDFGAGHRPVIGVTWGDLVTAFWSTGIPNIEIYFEANAFRLLSVTANQYWGWVGRGGPGKSWLASWADLLPADYSAADRSRQGSVVIGEVRRGDRRERARLSTTEAYTCSADVATLAIERVLTGTRRPGFATPAQLFGADFVLAAPGTRRELLM